MLMRTDPFRDLDRLTQQVFGPNGTLARPSREACGVMSPLSRSTLASTASSSIFPATRSTSRSIETSE